MDKNRYLAALFLALFPFFLDLVKLPLVVLMETVHTRAHSHTRMHTHKMVFGSF